MARSRVSYGGILVAKGGAGIDHDGQALAEHMMGDEISIEVHLGAGKGKREDDRDRPWARLHQREFEDVMTAAETAQVLVEALPYIQKFAGKSVVVKLGGAAIDKQADLALAQDVLLLRSVGVRCVLVHGGGPQVDAMLRRVGKEPEFRNGLRVTDAETLEIVRMVLVGKINPDLVATINSQAGDDPVAIGVSGEDAGLLTVTPADPSLGFVGNVTGVRAELDPSHARRWAYPRDLHRGRQCARAAIQRQRRRGGAGDRGCDGRGENRLSDRRSRPARGCRTTSRAWSTA